MQALTSHSASCNNEERDLEYLLEVFGCKFSLQDIASAYCQARHNVDTTGEILCTSHVSSSGSTGISKAKFEGASAVPTGLSSDNILQKPSNGVGNTRASKSKRLPVSVGTVSGVIGKEYIRPWTSTNESTEMKKPIKLDLKEVPVSEIWTEDAQSSMTEKNNTMNANVEEFLFKMLGDGFKLDMNVIREVLGLCGYDVRKSMEKLLFMSASTLEKSDDVVSLASLKSTEKCPDQHSAHSNGSRDMARNLIESSVEDKDALVLQKEILEALFHVPERYEEAPLKTSLSVRKVNRSTAFGNLVVEPYRDTPVENKTATVVPHEVTRAEDEDDENSYEVLRNNVKEYWITMKEYYKAASDAFSVGDRACADKFLEKGHFFNRKAREADEKSAQKLLQTRDDDVSLDLHNHEPKEAIRVLRLQLTYLSGTPAFKYLRVIVGTNDEDTTRGARRRLIMKQLEKESIKWTEEENGRTIVIRLDVIDPKHLSFAKKKREKMESLP